MTPLDLRTTPRIHHPRRWAALVPALLACYMDLLDATIVTVALPAFEEDLGAGPATLQWTSAGYTLAFAVLLMTGGRVGDIFGRKRTFLAGMAVFLLTSVLCGLARNPEMLVVSRVLQGAAAAMMIPQVLSFIQVEFPAPERPRALAMYGISLALGGMTGPVLGGLLIQADIAGLGWRAVFLINLPVGAAALLGALRLMPESRSTSPETSTPVTAPPAPACPHANVLKEVYQHGLQIGESVTSVSSVTCAEAWAVALINVSTPNNVDQDGEPVANAYTAVFAYSAGSWQNADTGRACSEGSIPESIRTLACNSN